MTIAPEEAVIVRTPGAGGYGDPAERTAEALEDDRTSGKFDEDWLAENYPQARQGRSRPSLGRFAATQDEGG